MRLKINGKNTLIHQYDFAFADPQKHPYPAIVGGYRSGKTMSIPLRWLALIEYREKRREKCEMFVVEPTYPLVRKAAVPTFNKFFTRYKIQNNYQKSSHEYSIRYNGTEYICQFVTAKNPENIVAFSKSDCIIDEFDVLKHRDIQEEVYDKCLARLSEAENSTLGIVTTPEGFRYTYDLYVKKNSQNKEYKLIKAKTSDNHFLPKGYVQSLYNKYDKQLVDQYVNGEFVNINGLSAHYAFSRDRHVAHVPTPEKGTPLHIGIDFNVHPMTACVGYYEGETYKVFSEYYLHNSNTFMLADLIFADYWSEHPIICYPDPSGSARKTSSDTSDMAILQKKGFDVRFRHGITQRRSLNYANGALSHDRIVIDPRCKQLIADLDQVVTDSYGQIEKPNGTMLTHISDAMRNVILVNSLMKEESKGWARR